MRSGYDGCHRTIDQSRRPALVWHKEASLDAADLVIIPGGFSFGDYLRCGALAGRSPIMNAVLDHAARGGAVMGICNGFQVLTETGMVPGVLIRNAGLKFSCRNVGLRPAKPWPHPLPPVLILAEDLTIPIAHNEGNYFADAMSLTGLKAMVRWRSAMPASDAGGPANPNGASRDIAGVLSSNGRVLGHDATS